MTPLAPNIRRDKHDSFLKASVQDTVMRPEFIVGDNKKRVGKYDNSNFKTENELSRLNKQSQQASKSKFNHKDKKSNNQNQKENQNDV